MTLGGAVRPVTRPRIRTADDEHELPITSYEYFADRDPLTRAVMDRIARRRLDPQVPGGWRAGRRGGRAGELVDVEEHRVGAVHRADPDRARSVDGATHLWTGTSPNTERTALRSALTLWMQ